MKKSIVKIESISFAYRKNKIICDSLNLEIGRSEIVGIMGASGCGKTTLLRLISGFLPIQGGTISIDGRQISDWPPQQRPTSMVFQNYALFPYMSVKGNIGFGLRVRNISVTDREKKIDELLEMLQLQDVRDTNVQSLSGGQRQRVAIGRSLAVEPKVLLLDEPLSAVDERLRDDLRALIRTVLKQKHISAILVSHAFQDNASMCDRIAFWQGLKLTYPRTVEEWIKDPQMVDIAEMIGYKNIVMSEWIRSLIDGSSRNKENVMAIEMKASHIVIPEDGIEISPGNKIYSHHHPKIVVEGVVKTLRWRGAKRYIILSVKGTILEAYSEVPLDEGTSVTVSIDTSQLIGIDR